MRGLRAEGRGLVAAAILVVLGTAQMAGDLLHVLPLKAVAAATGASPAPKVFSSVQGLETYSTRFYLDLGHERVLLTPELSARIRGPYNRRNVYGAALAFGPVLPPSLRDPVMRYALCGEAPLLRELGLHATRTPAIDVEPLPGTSLGKLPTRIEAPCR
jgi:hypothetical protein